MLYWERMPYICFTQAALSVNAKNKIQDQERELLENDLCVLRSLFARWSRAWFGSLAHFMLGQWVRRGCPWRAATGKTLLSHSWVFR